MSENKPLIYVVDDDPGIRDLLAEYLSGQGFEVGLPSTSPVLIKIHDLPGKIDQAPAQGLRFQPE